MEPVFYQGVDINTMKTVPLLQALQQTDKYDGMTQKQITDTLGSKSVYVLRSELSNLLLIKMFFPNEMIEEIMNHLDLPTLFNFCKSNKTVCKNNHFFKTIYHREFPQSKLTPTTTWLKLLYTVYQINQLGKVLNINMTMDELFMLTELNLDNKKLTTLPPEIGQLHQLRKLYLSGNKLTTLPPEIGQLHQLETLYVTHNQLTTLPPEIGQLHR